MDFTEAEIVHREWKLKLRSALINRESLDEAAISADDCCKLGKWLHGEAKNRFGELRSYADCVEKHVRFHQCAGNVAKAINAKKYDEAEAMLAASTEYMFASVELLEAISVLKSETGC
ncbi:MAG: CZB domain-containing protein [Sterolibacterium sp.]|nr:CZB domain-containing protein [Sterolibacterium sp.]